MTKKQSIPGTAEAWETGELGRSDAHASRVDPKLESQIDEALGLQAISIRLPKATIDAYKNLAKIHGVGYQPLMRDAICRWADAELKMLLTGAVESQRAAKSRPSKGVRAETHVDTDQPPPMKRAA